MSTDLWGQDIALDVDGQAKVAANGELVLTEGVDTGVQDIRLRLLTRLGKLFYDTDYGSTLPDWIHEESTPATRAAFVAEVVRCVNEDPRVVTGTVRGSILKWDATQLQVAVDWLFIDVDHPLNLVLQADKTTQAFVVLDVKHGAPTAAEGLS